MQSADSFMGLFWLVFAVAAVCSIGLAIWRFVATHQAGSDLGVDSATTTLLALSDPDNAATTMISTAALANQIADSDDAPASLDAMLADLQAARANGNLSEDEYAALRQRVLAKYGS